MRWARCNRAISLYNGNDGTLTMVKDSVYESNDVRFLSRQKPIELFDNFEDWHMGKLAARCHTTDGGRVCAGTELC
jgi:hypothetical protein